MHIAGVLAMCERLKALGFFIGFYSVLAWRIFMHYLSYLHVASCFCFDVHLRLNYLAYTLKMGMVISYR